MDEKRDPYTGECFIPKRRNQIFENRKNQINYNNEKARGKRELVKGMNRELLKNRDILYSITNGTETKEASYEFLKGMGFNFGILLAKRVIEGKLYHVYYDHGLHIINNFSILIKPL